MDVVAEKMQIPTAHIWGVATFYHYFNLKPIGRHTISVCMGTACYVKGADKVVECPQKGAQGRRRRNHRGRLFTFRRPAVWAPAALPRSS
jgi:NADH:ubiquinone oxidoreductase subunit E